jgi:shikimate dehydrogenase
MGDAPGALTRTLALIGDPVSHSLSPRIHNAAIRHLGIDAVYVALRCEAASVAPLMRGLAEAGGGGSVTVPHKARAAAALDEAAPAVRRTGACNAFREEQGRLCGDNTDVAGFRSAAIELLPGLHDARVLVIGAGGAAAAVLCALVEDRVARIAVCNRSPARARELALRLDPHGRTIHVVTDAAGELAAADLVVNATSLGLHDDDPLPLALAGPTAAAILDLVYRPGGATPWVRHAREVGLRAADGTGMLLAQAVAAFRFWFDREPPIDVMRDALAGAPAARGPARTAP